MPSGIPFVIWLFLSFVIVSKCVWLRENIVNATIPVIKNTLNTINIVRMLHNHNVEVFSSRDC